MSDDKWYSDIEEPEESTYLKSKDLYNRILLVRPVAPGDDVGEDGKKYTFWSCDVVVLSSSGIEEHGADVRIAWRNVQKGLANRQGTWCLVKAVQRGQAWVLDHKAVPQAAHDLVAGLKDTVEALFTDAPAPASAPAATYSAGEEPF